MQQDLDMDTVEVSGATPADIDTTMEADGDSPKNLQEVTLTHKAQAQAQPLTFKAEVISGRTRSAARKTQL